MLTESDIAQLGNNRFLVSYRRIVAGAYNTGEVGKRALYEYKKEGNKLLIKCTYLEDRTDLEWDEIPEDTWTEKYTCEVIKDGQFNKEAIKKQDLEHIYKEEEFKPLCEWHELDHHEFHIYYRLGEEKFNELKQFILKN